MNGLDFLMMPLVLIAAAPASVARAFETDVLPTAAGDLKITFIGHASLMFEFGGKVVDKILLSISESIGGLFFTCHGIFASKSRG